MVITIFTAEHVTRASDNGDRRLPIKVSVVPLVNPKNLQGVFASRVPAAGRGWENLSRVRSYGCRLYHAKYPKKLGLGHGPNPSLSEINLNWRFGIIRNPYRSAPSRLHPIYLWQLRLTLLYLHPTSTIQEGRVRKLPTHLWLPLNFDLRSLRQGYCGFWFLRVLVAYRKACCRCCLPSGSPRFDLASWRTLKLSALSIQQQVLQLPFSCKLPFYYESHHETINKRYYCNTSYTGSSHPKLKAATKTFPGGCWLNCTHHRYAYKSIYAIINNMIPNKVDRSIA